MELKRLALNPILCMQDVYSEEKGTSRSCTRVATHTLDGEYACYECVINAYRAANAGLMRQLAVAVGEAVMPAPDYGETPECLADPDLKEE